MYLGQAEVLNYLGEYSQAVAVCQEARSIFNQTSDAIGKTYVQLAQAGDICMALGLHTQARPTLESALRVMRKCNNVEQSMIALLRLAESSLRDGDIKAAQDYMQQIDELPPPPLPVWQLATRAWLQGSLALACGDYQYADTLCCDIERLIEAGSDPNMLGPMWVLRAQIALARGDQDAARACFERAEQAAQTRSSFAVKLFVLQEAGARLATDAKAEFAALGRQCLEEASVMRRHLDAERERYTSMLWQDANNHASA
jgi:tetratricopeptide (TPR) repeat protein